MPILMLAFFALQLDRANIGNALTDNFLKDIDISQNMFNVGQQLLNAGIVLLEIPSNIILYRLGPKIWISGQIFAWGLVATFQAFQHGLPAFLATRLLLGMLESGFIPGGLFTLSLWYKGGELSKRFALYFIGNGLATAAGGLLAYAILHMRGVAGLAGWQWLFILEGIFTILAGVVFACLFPGSPSNPVSLTGIRYFNDREVMILQQRIVLDDPSKVSKKQHIGLSDIINTLKNAKLWFHITLTTVGLAPTTALWSYAPSIVASFGYDRLAANAMTSIGNWISVFLLIVAGVAADKWGRRGFIVLIAVTIEFIFTVAYKCLPDNSGASLKFGILTMACATCSWWHAVNGSWLSINARSPAERSIRMAMFIMAANCAGIVGGQLFRSDDLPYYHRGWNIAVSFMSLSVALVIGLLILYVVANRRMKKSGNVVTSYNVYTDDKGRDPAVLEQASNDQTPKQQLYNF
ncbi:putative alternative sulfate transporter protein [Phaeoacremonium minimum UCRPA7]|uniref:Putative alternative sulfate transporter protein n=1 Tax=Phaeoacremonium minimum (strain UCR-PA7) TaxID=1286976 RepID=R8BGM9_PHAM7|nr:putative alternative sulfate transporter protein [Phaeoacremonium minimum UCRPA7]EON98495.1 putative alternative sulfate transporter protein [Phaeoacremonium minimum UCRPA7]